MLRVVSSLIFASWCLVGAGCAAATAQRAEHLTNASRSFHDGLLFRHYQLVASHLLAEHRQGFLTRAFRVEETLSVTEVEILSATLAEDGKSAKTLTRLSYFTLPSTILHTETVVVDWVHQDGTWQIERIEGGPLPVP